MSNDSESSGRVSEAEWIATLEDAVTALTVRAKRAEAKLERLRDGLAVVLTVLRTDAAVGSPGSRASLDPVAFLKGQRQRVKNI